MSFLHSYFMSIVKFFPRIFQYNYEKNTKNDVAFWDSATGKITQKL